MFYLNKKLHLLLLLSTILVFSCSTDKNHRLQQGNIIIEFNDDLHSRISANFNGDEIHFGPFSASEYVISENGKQADFKFLEQKEEKNTNGTVYKIKGENSLLAKELTVTFPADFPAMAVYKVSYKNISDSAITISGWANHHYQIDEKKVAGDSIAFWSYQSGSYENRPDWVLPLTPGFEQKNYLGMNASDYGGGTPVVDVWRRDAGLAVGHVELNPKLVSLPVQLDSSGQSASVAVRYENKRLLKPGETLTTFSTFVSVHQGDYFTSLQNFSRYMRSRGIAFREAPASAYEPVWCAWGYEREFKVQDVLNTLPKVKEMGYKWAVLDDGWQTAEGDWYLNPKKFPRGAKDMRALVDKIHSYGLKAKLWWAPLAVDPGTDLYNKHPELLLINKQGKPQDISWWDSYYLCPAYPPTIEYTKKLVRTFLKDWGFDGLKIDGQHLNAAPPCYNPAHKHKRPDESVEQMPEFFKAIYETALSIKPDAVVEICPCGTAYSFYTMPYMNQPVSSDPTSSWQIRLKGKTFKALMGPRTAYYGDHVELSDGRSDFASTIGIGGVPGSKFTWPVGVHINTESGDVSLTPAKEKEWKKWNRIYLEHNLAQGEYLGGLYDIGFDRPETHVIRKDGMMYFAFYAKKYKGEVEIRGLPGQGTFTVTDYVNGKDLGKIQGNHPRLAVDFEGSLLLRVDFINGR